MRTYCERFSKIVIPAIRAIAAEYLIKKYHLTQVKVAELLGTTQASISYYLRHKRGKKCIELLREQNQILSIITEIAELAYKRNPEEKLALKICDICKIIRSDGSLKAKVFA